jgi:hypothetical protein
MPYSEWGQAYSGQLQSLRDQMAAHQQLRGSGMLGGFANGHINAIFGRLEPMPPPKFKPATIREELQASADAWLKDAI